MENKQLLNTRNKSSKTTGKPFLVSVLSGKGGVGKSIITYNLACIMAREGHRCLIVDADWDFGNQHILANTIPKTTLADISTGQSSCQDAVVKLTENLHLIASPASSDFETVLNTGLYSHFLESARKQCELYDLVIIDTPSGSLDIIPRIANISDLCLIILTPELTSIANAYGLLKFLVNSNKNLSTHIFVNRIKSGIESELLYQKFILMTERFLGMIPSRAGYLYEREEITESMEQQKSLITINSESPTIDQFLTLCQYLINEKIKTHNISILTEETNINSSAIITDIKG